MSSDIPSMSALLKAIMCLWELLIDRYLIRHLVPQGSVTFSVSRKQTLQFGTTLFLIFSLKFKDSLIFLEHQYMRRWWRCPVIGNMLISNSWIISNTFLRCWIDDNWYIAIWRWSLVIKLFSPHFYWIISRHDRTSGGGGVTFSYITHHMFQTIITYLHAFCAF